MDLEPDGSPSPHPSNQPPHADSIGNGPLLGPRPMYWRQIAGPTAGCGTRNKARSSGVGALLGCAACRWRV